MLEQPQLPCETGKCPINSVTATSLGFIKLHGARSDMGQKIIKLLEKGGIEPDLLAECIRKKCGHVIQMRQQSQFAEEVILTSRLIMRKKKPTSSHKAQEDEDKK